MLGKQFNKNLAFSKIQFENDLVLLQAEQKPHEQCPSVGVWAFTPVILNTFLNLIAEQNSLNTNFLITPKKSFSLIGVSNMRLKDRP